jgi:hypothetical protein
VASICVAGGVIAALFFLWLGPPSQAREYRQNEFARFAPTVVHGIVQLVGETLLLSCVVYVSRRWLRIRL